MKNLLVYILLSAFFLLNGKYVFAQTSEITDFGTNPGNLRMYLHIPAKVVDTINYPLVVVLHGCSQNAKQVEGQSGWSVLADSHHFFVIYPEQKLFNNPNGCFNWFNEGDIETGKGEVQSIANMIRSVSEDFNIDTSRVFIYGLSAGAAMSVAVMSCYPFLINTGAVLAGGPYKPAAGPFDAMSSMKHPKIISAEERGKKVKEQNEEYMGTYPKLIVFHGEKDKVVAPENSDELLKQWSYLHQTDLNADSLFNDYDNKKDFFRAEYKNDEGEIIMIKYLLKSLGHALAIDPGKGEKQGGKTGLFSKDADVFSTWYIANDFGLINKKD